MSSKFLEAYYILELEPGSSSRRIANAIRARGLTKKYSSSRSPSFIERVNKVFELWLAKHMEELESLSNETSEEDTEEQTDLNNEVQGSDHSSVANDRIQSEQSTSNVINGTRNKVTRKSNWKILVVRNKALVLPKKSEKRAERSRNRLIAGSSRRQRKRSSRAKCYPQRQPAPNDLMSLLSETLAVFIPPIF